MPATTLAPPPDLDAGDFRLHALAPAHEPLWQRALDENAAHLRVWIPHVVDGRVPGLTLAERLARHHAAFVAGTEWVWGMFAPDDSEVLGGCGLYPRVGPGAVEVGYWLARRAMGRGLATAAARLLTDIAFASPHIARVEMHVDAGNVASAGVPRRLGFRHAETITEADGATLMVWCAEREPWLERHRRR